MEQNERTSFFVLPRFPDECGVTYSFIDLDQYITTAGRSSWIMVEQYNLKKNLYLGYITVFLDIIGFSLIVPILLYLSKDLGATSTQEGILFSTYCITQMISMMSCNSFIIRFTLYGILQWFLWTKDVPSSFISRIMFGYHI